MRFLLAALLLLLPVAASATPVTFDFRASNVLRNQTPGFDEPLNIRILLTYDTDKNQDLAPDDPNYGWYDAAQSLDVFVNDRLFAGSNLGPVGIQDSPYSEHFYASGLLTAYDNGQQLNFDMYSLLEDGRGLAGNWNSDALITDVPQLYIPRETMFFFRTPGDPNNFTSLVQLDIDAWTKLPEPEMFGIFAASFAGLMLVMRRRRKALGPRSN